MNRRDFLKLMGIGAAGVAAPKFIFDMGANLYKQEAALARLDELWPIKAHPRLVMPTDSDMDAAFNRAFPVEYQCDYLPENVVYGISSENIVLFHNGNFIKLT